MPSGSNPASNPEHRPKSKAAKAAKASRTRRSKEMTSGELNKFRDWCISAKHVENEEEFDALIGPLIKFIDVTTTTQIGFTILNYTIIKTGGPDDSMFLRFPLLQKILPRNLCIITTPWGDDIISGGMRKFFGNEDTRVESNIIKAWASIKENGKFTAHMFVQGPDGTVYMIFGSKNRMTVVDLSTVPNLEDAVAFKAFCKTMGLNEILVSMLEALMKIVSSPGFNIEKAILLGKEGKIIVGENCDGKHITYEEFGNNTKFFAICNNGVPMNTIEARGILESIGYPLVECVELPNTIDIHTLTISDLEEAGIKFKPNCEGCVVYLECEDGTTKVMKFKFPIYKLLRTLRRLIFMFGWSAITLAMLHDAIISKACYNDISAEAAVRFYKWAVDFITCCDNAGISPKRVNFMLDAWGEKVLDSDMYGMGAIIHHFGMDTGLYVLQDEIGLKDLDLFKKDFEILTSGMIPTLSIQEIEKVVICLVGPQGSGKTSKGKAAEKIWEKDYSHLLGGLIFYMDQDERDGSSAETREAMCKRLKDPRTKGIVLGRTNHHNDAVKAYLEELRKTPNVAVIFVGDEPNDVAEVLYAFGLVSRTPQALLDNGSITFGVESIEGGEGMEIAKKVQESIHETFFGESPTFPIHTIKTVKEGLPFSKKLTQDWSLLSTFDDQRSFLAANSDLISSMRVPLSDIGEELCQIFSLMLSPPKPESLRFIRMFNVNANYWPVHFELDYVSGKLGDAQGRKMITFGMEMLSEHGIHATAKSEGKGKGKPNGKVNPRLHLTIHHPKGGGLNPGLPDGCVIPAEVSALVIHKESGHAAFRLCPILDIKNPHFTLYVPNDRKPAQSGEFVGLNDDSVIVIPMDGYSGLELVVENVAKR